MFYQSTEIVSDMILNFTFSQTNILCELLVCNLLRDLNGLFLCRVEREYLRVSILYYPLYRGLRVRRERGAGDGKIISIYHLSRYVCALFRNTSDTAHILISF